MREWFLFYSLFPTFIYLNHFTISGYKQLQVFKNPLMMHDSSEYENVHLQSRWSIGLKTPLLMVGSFILAFLVAALHAIFYQVLAGTPTDGPESRVSQTYETTISVILSSTFTLLIHFCLGLSFTQYLWYILRRQPLATSVIEHMFTLRSNPLSLFDGTVFRRARPLVMVAIIYWSASIAMSFPPGAITVVSSLKEIIVRDAVVPTFNASDFGDLTPDFIEEKSLFQIMPSWGTYEEHPLFKLFLDIDYDLKPALHGMIHQTLLAKHIEDASSPCSANCSYSLYFTGPYVQCKGTTNTSTLISHGPQSKYRKALPVFNSSTEQRVLDYDSLDYHKDPQLHSYVTISTSSPQSFGYRPLSKVYDTTIGELKIETINHYWNCTPSRADYTVHATYKDNMRSLKVNIDENSIEPLLPAPPALLVVQEGDQPLNYSLALNPAVVPILRDANLYSIITPVMKTISGTFNASLESAAVYGSPSTHTDSIGFEYYNFTSTFPPDIYFSPNSSHDFMNVLPIAQYFSDATISPSFSNLSVENGASLFTINEARINAMLQDVVLSMISYQSNNWTTRVNQTRNEIRTIYTFSRPLNLFLPYGLMLLSSLCTMILGFYALRSNGVSATDGGFLQLFTTAQRSDTVDRIARGGCLGGEENVSTTLKDLKIQFGELIKATDGPEMEVFSTAGFGTEHEVRPLKRERIYGSL